MSVCITCGLPDELCVCGEIARSGTAIRVKTVSRRYGKLVTLVEGADEPGVDMRDLTQKLKGACACGGTEKSGVIELQGDHVRRVRQVLESMGYRLDS